MMAIFEALADPTRQRILALLHGGEHSVGDLVEQLGVAQPSVSKHLTRLKRAGLVDLRAEAQRRVYRLTPEPLRNVDEWLRPYLKPPAGDDRVDFTLRKNRHGMGLGFEVSTESSAEAVWAAISDPAGLSTWLGKARVQPHERGRFRAQFAGSGLETRGKFNVWSPQRKLGYLWRLGDEPGTPVTRVLFELAYGERGASLVVTHDRVPSGRAMEFAALWHAHLERLAPALRGQSPVLTPERLEFLRTSYASLISPPA